MTKKFINRLNVVRAAGAFEHRGDGSDIILLILGTVGMVFSLIMGVIAFVQFEASPECLRFIGVTNLAWIIPTIIGNNLANEMAEIEEKNEGEE